jgi:ABC-type nitrate/sulfonate/bicarbonate transport system substrate-binding protein
MQFTSSRIIVAIILLASAQVGGRSAAAENIQVSYASLSTSYMDHIVAMEKGYFREKGLHVETVRAGGGVATPALLSGRLHFSTSASSALSAAIRGGPVKIVYTNLSHFTYKLVSNKPEIKTVKDLVGKKVAIATFGDTFHLSTLLLLKKYGIPSSSVLFIAVGRVEARFAAFKVGSVDATPLAPRDLIVLGQTEGHMLADISKEIQLVGNGVAVSDKLLAENPLLVERFLHGVVKGREYARRYKEQTVGMVAKHDPTPQEAIAIEYDATVPSMTEEGWLPPEVVKDEVATRAEIVKQTQPPDPSRLFDYSIVRKIYAELKSAGWKPNP